MVLVRNVASWSHAVLSESDSTILCSEHLERQIFETVIDQELLRHWRGRNDKQQVIGQAELYPMLLAKSPLGWGLKRQEGFDVSR